MNIADFKSGTEEDRYQYKAFLPKKICHEWIIADPALIEILSRADRALGELNAFALLIPDIDFFVRMYVAKEATQSSRIEGTQTNIEDAFKDARDLNLEKRNDWAEVQNYIKAISYAIKALDKLPLSNRLLRQTHKILMSGVRGKHQQPGQFRTSQNWIGVNFKQAVFIPPHHDHVPDLMSDLETFLHADHLYVPPLVRIAIGHYQFETIHPFLDGNGRLGRLMISLYLASTGLLVKPALYLSDYFERNRSAYVDQLMAVRQGHHLREWLIFFLHGVAETARSATDIFRNILEIKGRIEQDTLPRFGSRRQDHVQNLMRYLYSHPVVNVNKTAEFIGTTTNTANALIMDMVAHGVLTEITGQRRNRLFVFREYLDLFKR
ncbi:MAG: Fic family protein [Rhodobacteraceae bacterium]|nr:Fic family protein [Paracoccaceae bacterium]MCY4197753.1 Fic family protein [Paracoccaceae bacterium]